jgi:uroporphyrin-III C-methyltransferase
MNIGTVYLVGAGPGDPELITRKGLRLLREADVVIYDRLIPQELLDEVRPGTLLIYAGKMPQKHRLSQDAINETIVEYALKGKQVVRLKGGDPLVFGRGSEEALVCHAYDIPFEIVPGISSSYAVPAYAGIPLTHRNISSSFTVITGHEDPTKPDTRVNYTALAQMGGTIVILMGVVQLPQIVAQLIDAGLNPATPAAVVEQGTTEAQRVVSGNVEQLPELAQNAGIESPATIVIGEVVALRDQGVQWFDRVKEAVPVSKSLAAGD